MSRYLIVGVDPGTTTAVAVLDFGGRVVGVHSARNLGLSGVIDYVVSLGKPSVVACDVANPPEFVSKVAASLGAVLYSPDESLTVSEKLELTRDFAVSGAHQRDALAAALSAYAKFRNKFEKIDSLGLEDEVKHRVLRGTAIGKALSVGVGGKKPVPDEGGVVSERQPTVEERRVKALEKRVFALLEQISGKDEELSSLRFQLARVKRESHTGLHRDRELVSRENSIKSLRNKISVLEGRLGEMNQLKDFVRSVLSGRVLVVGVYPEVTGGLTLAKRVLDKKELSSLKGVRAVFTDEGRNKKMLEDEGFTVADPKMLKKAFDFYYIQKRDLEKLRENKKISIEKLVEEYRNRGE